MKLRDDEKDMHKNHRNRLFQEIENVGLDKLNQIKQLEFILTLVIPRVDVNPISHRLLAKFGTLASVLNAPVPELAKVRGLGKRSAFLLSQFRRILTIYKIDMAKKNERVHRKKHILDYVKGLFLAETKEMLYLIICKGKGEIVSHIMIAEGDFEKVHVTPKQIVGCLYAKGATSYYLTHNHPFASASASWNDAVETKILSKNIASVNVPMIDHIVYGCDGLYSMKNQAMQVVFE